MGDQHGKRRRKAHRYQAVIGVIAPPGAA
jgi:hypothetical protein